MRQIIKKRLSRISNFLFTILIVYFLILISIDIYHINAQQRKLENLQKKVTEIESLNKKISEYNKKLKDDPVELEKLARKLGMKKKGEKVYRFWENNDKLDIKIEKND